MKILGWIETYELTAVNTVINCITSFTITSTVYMVTAVYSSTYYIKLV